MTPRTPHLMPNLLVIGAAKAGSTSLHHYLGQHPQIAMAAAKETGFFVRTDWREALDEYAQNFSPADVRGETDGTYAAHPIHPNVPERIHAVAPDVKLVYLVRDPIDRSETHYHQRYISRRESRPIEEAFAELNDENLYVAYSKYMLQIEQYLKYFSPERLHIVESSDLRKDRVAALRSVFEFLEVDPDSATGGFTEELNISAGKRRSSRTSIKLRKSRFAGLTRRTLPPRLRDPVMGLGRRALSTAAPKSVLPEGTRARLSEAFREDVSALREFAGRDFANWSV